MSYKCPVCESPIKVPARAAVGERIVCENCFAELALHNYKGNFFLGCPFCKEEIFNPTNCGPCERRQTKVSQWKLDGFIKL